MALIRKYPASFILLFSLLLINSARAQVIQDDFADTSINTSIWTPSTPFSDSSITETGGNAVFENRGRLLSVAALPQHVLVTGSFAFTGNIHDSFAVLLRTNGVSTNASGEFDTGIRFGFTIEGDTGNTSGNISIARNDYPSNSANLSTATYAMALNTSYSFLITDDGTNLALYINNYTQPVLTATDSTILGAQLGMYNREGAAAGSSISAGGIVQLADIEAYAFSAPPAPPVRIALSQVRNSQNPPDSSSYGAVNYDYQIGTNDITINQYATFLNAVAASDPYGLYNSNLETNANIAGILQSGTAGNYTYSVIGTSGGDPVTYVTWLDAARFCNWLQNGQPTTLGENTGSTETGAYTLNGDTTSGLESKNPSATWWIPSENEWYKAAYYDPTVGGTGGYWIFPTRSNVAPGNLIGTGTNDANYYTGIAETTGYSLTQSSTFSPLQSYLTPVGSFTGSPSYYGTYDQGGDVFQWNDVIVNTSRGVRGGSWVYDSYNWLQSAGRNYTSPLSSNFNIGFRVATLLGAVSPGRYTFLLSSTNAPASADNVSGYGTMTIGTNARVVAAGKLPDGTPFVASGLLIDGSNGYEFDVAKALPYPSVLDPGSSGFLYGSLFFKQTANTDFNGTFKWIKPEQTRGGYPAAIDTDLTVVGSQYTPPSQHTTILPGFKDGLIALSDTGTLISTGTNALTDSATLGVNNIFKLGMPLKDRLTFTITPSTGAFRGSFLYPGAPGRKPIILGFGGVLFQDQTLGSGLFLGPNGSGSVTLTGT